MEELPQITVQAPEAPSDPEPSNAYQRLQADKLELQRQQEQQALDKDKEEAEEENYEDDQFDESFDKTQKQHEPKLPAILADKGRIQYNERKDFKDHELDTISPFVDRQWTQVEDGLDISGIQDNYDSYNKAQISLRLLHWNILAKALAAGLPKVDDDAPMLQFDNRLRLMREHLE